MATWDWFMYSTVFCVGVTSFALLHGGYRKQNQKSDMLFKAGEEIVLSCHVCFACFVDGNVCMHFPAS
jgi:hypothetical protein